MPIGSITFPVPSDQPVSLPQACNPISVSVVCLSVFQGLATTTIPTFTIQGPRVRQLSLCACHSESNGPLNRFELESLSSLYQVLVSHQAPLHSLHWAWAHVIFSEVMSEGRESFWRHGPGAKVPGI